LISVATILTPREQSQTASAARKVGGYDELLRLERERRKIARDGSATRVHRDPGTGRFNVERG
jgi:hypothetical protein